MELFTIYKFCSSWMYTKDSYDGTGELFLISLFLVVVFPMLIIPMLQYSYGSNFLTFEIPNGLKLLMV
jgi:hypothetical protein